MDWMSLAPLPLAILLLTLLLFWYNGWEIQPEDEKKASLQRAKEQPWEKKV